MTAAMADIADTRSQSGTVRDCGSSARASAPLTAADPSVVALSVDLNASRRLPTRPRPLAQFEGATLKNVAERARVRAPGNSAGLK